MKKFHCPNCGRVLFEYENRGELFLKIKCRRCGKYVALEVKIQGSKGERHEQA